MHIDIMPRSIHITMIAKTVPIITRHWVYVQPLISPYFSTVKAIIDHEVKNGIPANRVMLGGFSQVRLLNVNRSEGVVQKKRRLFHFQIVSDFSTFAVETV
jgi:hypothetical protein